MKSVKLLLVSFTITFVILSNISPALAKSAIKIQYLNVSNAYSSSYNNYNFIKVVAKTPSTLASQYRNNFSTGLILSNPTMLTLENSPLTMNVVNNSNEFFNSAMAFSDKLNQFISYFTSPVKGNITEQLEPTPKSKVIKAKCNSKV
ncbi:hypothetical protein CMT41_04910 [Colwellia sp. MT41]|uniref:Uncharacterized protein n=1 Tax=Colwellia marinimaniae TaxID=1513592 RepID=A0ABQ0MQV7_9GAMM|nr:MULTISPECIES: hypothetical protein [Colwellia]ALO34144.1 hypothetical protein CMT41_04910 [Colwellia sp. MT41]GAW94753.1 hypothetical protein MTCD1_00350 [Colwellia marinimaniae]